MLLDSPGTTCVSTDPPPGPLTACRLILCVSDVPGEFFSVSSTVSPWRTRIIGPGTVPLKVQKGYATPSANKAVTSRVSRSTLTSAGSLRSMGGATCGCGIRVTPSGRGLTTDPTGDPTGGLTSAACSAWTAAESPTTSLPAMPASLWPGIEQKNSYVPGVLNVKSPPTVWPGLASSDALEPSTCRLCWMTPRFWRLR